MSHNANDNQSHATPRLRGPVVVAGVLAIMASLTMGAVVVPSLAMRTSRNTLEVYGTLPAFVLTDQTGAQVTEQQLAGKVVIANFVFTRCNTVCPVFSMKMRRVQDRTHDVFDRLKLVSFSVDPEYDTPEVLARYATRHHANPGRWLFLTGDPGTVRDVVTGGLAMVMEQRGVQTDGAPNIVHAEHFVLIDQAGRIRGYYDSNDAVRIERMLNDARRLIFKGD